MRRHPVRNFFRHLTRSAWWQPNKESRKMLKEEADKLIGWDKEANPAWAKSWKYFAKRQFPWYGLLELNQYKIIEMRDYMQHHSITCEEETEKQIKEMTEVIDLGYKILDDKYDNEAFDYLHRKTVPVTFINKGPLKKREEIATLYSHDMFENLSSTLGGEKEPISKEKEDFLKDKDTRSADEWLKDNGLTKKDIFLSYSSVWIDASYKQIWKKMIKQAYADRKKDKEKYFKLIAKHLDEWGD